MSIVDRYRKRCQNDGGIDEGFTLIELLVVLLIIGILLAIAIPTFLGVTKSANNTAAQSNLQTALTGAKSFYTNGNQSYVGLFNNNGATSSIQQIDTGVSYVSGANSSGPHNVSLQSNAAGTDVIMTAISTGTKDCWGILDVTASGATISGIAGSAQTGTFFFVTKNVGTSCNAATYLAGTVAGTTSSTTSFPPG